MPWGPWKKLFLASMSKLIVSMEILVIYPSKMLSTQNLVAVEIGLRTLSNRQISSRVHYVGSPP